MIKEYKTVLTAAFAEYEEKKSRFIANVKPVVSDEEAVDFINGLKSKYWDASHNVYSYYIVGNNIIQRFSDDGEPSGTAGLPIMEVIKRSGLQDIAIVVTRYFGGTLLGASGLIRAYGKSAALGIEAAEIVTKKLCTNAKVIVEYTLFGKVQSLLISMEYIIRNVNYERDVELSIYIPVDDEPKFQELMIEATNARAIIEFGEKSYITLNGQGKIIT